MGWLVLMGWVTSWANKREDYFNYFGKGARISRNWVTAHFLAFYGQPWNCHGTCGCVISVQSLSRVQLCDPMNHSTPGLPVHHQLLESTQTHVHFILCRSLLLLPPVPPSIRVFSSESALHIKWPKYWSFSFNISPSSEHPGLISFRMDRLDLLAVHVSFSIC